MTNSAPAADSEQAEIKVHPWAGVTAEHLRLIRLAPLPGDRATGNRGLRFAQLGRVERHSPEESLLRLSIDLPQQMTLPGHNTLEVWADHRSREVRFGLDGGLHIEPANRGLGRFLLAQGIGWAKRRFAAYAVEGQALAAKDALTDDARGCRDQFLRAQGFRVEYLDPAQLKGRCEADVVGTLRNDWNNDKIQLIDPLDAAGMLEQADHLIRQQEQQLRQRDDTVARLSRDDSALRFSIACLVVFCTFQAGLLIWMASH
jgi:hypothetical protein